MWQWQSKRAFWFFLLLPCFTACGSDPNTDGGANARVAVAVQNAFDPAVAPVGLAKVAYGGAVFDFTSTGLSAGETSDPQTVADTAAPAYALVQFGWQKGTPFTKLDVVKSTQPIDAASGRVVFSFPSHVGKCGGTPPMGKDEYNAIKQQHFANDPRIEEYDAIACP